MKDKKVEIKWFLFVGAAILAASNGLIASRQEGKSFIAVFIISLLVCFLVIVFSGDLGTWLADAHVTGESIETDLYYYHAENAAAGIRLFFGILASATAYGIVRKITK